MPKPTTYPVSQRGVVTTSLMQKLVDAYLRGVDSPIALMGQLHPLRSKLEVLPKGGALEDLDFRVWVANVSERHERAHGAYPTAPVLFRPESWLTRGEYVAGIRVFYVGLPLSDNEVRGIMIQRVVALDIKPERHKWGVFKSRLSAQDKADVIHNAACLAYRDATKTRLPAFEKSAVARWDPAILQPQRDFYAKVIRNIFMQF